MFLKLFSDRDRPLLLATCLLAFGLRIFRLNAPSMWFDEALSALFALMPFRVSIEVMLLEGLHHSPLYYLLLRPFALWGFDEFLLRLVSVMAGVLLVPLMACLGRALGYRKAGLWASLLVAVNPFHIWYSQETRPYTLLAFIAAGAMFFFGRLLARPSRRWNLVGLSLFLAAGFNTHHFIFFIPLVQFVYLLVTFKRNHRLLRPWFLAQSLAALTLVPWLIVVLNWGHYYFISNAPPRVGGDTLFKTFWNFSLGYTGQLTLLAALALTLCAGLAGLAVWRNGRRLGLLLLWLLLPLLLAFVISLRLPMYLDRYLIVSFAPYLLVVALGLTALPRPLGYGVAALLVAACAGNLYLLYFLPAGPQLRTDWRSVGHYLEEHVHPGDTMMVLYQQDLVPLDFYFTGTDKVKPVIEGEKIQLPDEPGGNRAGLWLITAYSCESEPGLYPYILAGATRAAPAKLVVKQWQEKNQSRLRETIDFACVRLYLY